MCVCLCVCHLAVFCIGEQDKWLVKVCVCVCVGFVEFFYLCARVVSACVDLCEICVELCLHNGRTLARFLSCATSVWAR